MSDCYHCGNELTPPLHRSTRCPSCGRDAKVCRNCEFYAPGLNNDCREPSAEPVHDKELANFCGYFQPSTGTSDSSPKKSHDAAEKAKKEFNALFGE